MSASNPPTYVVSIYNPSFFTTSTSGLTVGQASSLYLSKTLPDTAKEFITFTTGTKASNHDVVTPSSVMLIGPSQTSFAIAIGCADNRSGAVSLASGATQSANVNLCAGLTNTGSVNIANGLTNSGVINIASGTTNSGIVHIADGANNSGEVRIANATTNTGAIRIGDNGLGATGAITIGSSTMPTTIGSATLTLPTITFSYTTSPTLTSTQLGYQINTYLGASLNLNATNTNTNVLTISLPKGTWQCSYQVRITTIGALNVQVSNVFTTIQSFMNIPILTGGNVLGLNQINIPLTITSTNGNASNDNYASSSSAIVSNITGTQNLVLTFYGVYSGAGTPQAFASQTYLQALRIA